MTFIVEIVLTRSERAFERAVSLAGRRGYEVVGGSMTLAPDEKTLHVRLELSSDRRPELLVRQLGKLYEVRSVGLAPEPP